MPNLTRNAKYAMFKKGMRNLKEAHELLKGISERLEERERRGEIQRRKKV